MFSPLRPTQNCSPPIFHQILKVFSPPKICTKKSFFSPRGSAGMATLKMSSGSLVWEGGILRGNLGKSTCESKIAARQQGVYFSFAARHVDVLQGRLSFKAYFLLKGYSQRENNRNIPSGHRCIHTALFWGEYFLKRSQLQLQFLIFQKSGECLTPLVLIPW